MGGGAAGGAATGGGTSGVHETACNDGQDNDGDSKKDCADPDCVGAGTENCSDGIDNTCDQAIDCADSKCAGNSTCTNLNDGLPCNADAQCAGGKCSTEAASGLPNGACSNASPCSEGTTTGCHGGLCVKVFDGTKCQPRCTKDGLAQCRLGYVCFDIDEQPSNDNSFCIALCSSDSDCQTADAGAGRGCNVYSRLCERKDKGLSRYGASCNANNECETGHCFKDDTWPEGYCGGTCRADQMTCGAGGVCVHPATWADNVGICYQACSQNNQCRPLPYQCIDRGAGGYCQCRVKGESCIVNATCCSGICNPVLLKCF